MSSMFYNYDHQIQCCCPCSVETKCPDMPEILMGWSGAEIIYDPKGNEVGLGFNKGPIELTFGFSGCVVDDFGDFIDIDDFINGNDILFELLDFKQQVVYTSRFKALCEDQFMSVKLGKEVVEKLVPEVYYVKLTVITEYADYVLFTPRDGLIHIS